MKTILMISLLIISVSACTRTPVSQWENTTESLASVKGLEDCSLNSIKRKGEYTLEVIRCPNSTTTTSSNSKHVKNVTVIDE